MTQASRRLAAQGQALVEFSIVFGLVIVPIIVGLIDIGRAAYAYNTVGNASRVGARVAAVNQIVPNPTSSCDESRPVEDVATAQWTVQACAAATAVSLGVQPGDVDVEFRSADLTAGCSPRAVGCVAVVTVHYTYRPMLLFGQLPIPLDATSQMPIERVFP